MPAPHQRAFDQLTGVVLPDGTKTYVHGLDLISATDGAGNQTYFSYDAVGSVTDLTDLTDGAGVLTDTYAYDVFGTIKTHSGSSTNYWLFTGEQADRATGDTGYYFLRARYYDPALGRFISRDRLLSTSAMLTRETTRCCWWTRPACAGGASPGTAPITRAGRLWMGLRQWVGRSRTAARRWPVSSAMQTNGCTTLIRRPQTVTWL